MHRTDKHSDLGGDEQGPTEEDDTQKPTPLSLLVSTLFLLGLKNQESLVEVQ